MPELRQNRATKEWVIIATERAKRPEDFKSTKEKKEIPEYSPNCPFCPGNEDKTPPTLFSIGNGKNWEVRVTLNKYAALSLDVEPYEKTDEFFRSRGGYGHHEVVIETPKHNLTTALLPESSISNIIKTYKERYLAILKDKRIHNIIIFKNHGETAGTSLEHPHSQIVGTPVVPHQIRNRLQEAMRHYDDHNECIFCRTIKEELKTKERIIIETEFFVSFVPYAALTPFHLWIFPKRHNSTFGEIREDEISDLAKILRITLRKLYFGLNNPDYNYVIRSAPTDGRGLAYFHWYISIIPRLTKSAGFELGSGMFINVSLPEENAKFLREVNIPEII